MGMFKKNSKKDVAPTAAPEEPETPGEIGYVEQLSDKIPPIPEAPKEVAPQPSPTVQPPQLPVPEYREVPVCFSQAQINNLVIENNMMLKQLMAMAEED